MLGSPDGVYRLAPETGTTTFKKACFNTDMFDLDIPRLAAIARMPQAFKDQVCAAVDSGLFTAYEAISLVWDESTRLLGLDVERYRRDDADGCD
jgi:hypothetical protein